MRKAVLFIFILLLTSALWAQNRYALVIGNANYPKAEDWLPNAINDTNAVSAALRELGFSVELKQNLRRLDMVREISAFMTRLGNNRNSEGFLWYAGHAMEINGENLLFPLDVNIENDELIKATSFSLNDLTRQFGNAKNKVNVLVLDACRVPPSDSRSRGSGDVTRVIKTVPLTPPDLFVFYSTAPGTVALDGTGKQNSPFAEAFLKNVKSTEPLTIMSGHVTTDTLSLTGNRQRPYTSGSMGRDNVYYSLNPNNPLPPPPPPPPPPPFSQRGRATREMGSNGFSAAHDSLPINSKAYVTNASNGRQVEVTIFNRIPASSSRVTDLSDAVWLALELRPNDDVIITTSSNTPPSPPPPQPGQRGRATREMGDLGLVAAHPSLPIGSRAYVTNASNGRQVEVTITSRIPASSIRIADLSDSVWRAIELSPNSDVIITTSSQ